VDSCHPAPDGVRLAPVDLTEVSAMSSQRQSFQGAALRRLLLEQRGGVAAIMGLAIIPLFAVVGLAIDTGRGYMLKSKLSYAIDAAGLAGGRAFDTDLREEDIAMFFEANFPTNYMGSELLPDNPVVTFDDANNRIIIEATATVPTAFMGVVGVHEMTISARTVIQRELRGMELVLVMDNTGSMRGNGGMVAMKPAATELIEILYGDRETVPQFWVGVVPYVASVNIGTQHEDWLTGYDADDYAPTTWKGCIEAREYPRDSNDDPPDVEGWTPYLWRSTLNEYPNPYWVDPGDANGDGHADQDDWPTFSASNPATWGPYIPGDNEWDPDGAESDLNLDNDLYQNWGTGPNLGCGPAITPLVASKTTILSAIDEMAPWHRGGTMANLGLAWGWRVLSPRWRGFWDGDLPDELPLDYDVQNMEKVVILLTDGNNEWYDWPGPDSATVPSTASGNCGEGSTVVPLGGLPGNNNAKNTTCQTLRTAYPGGDYNAYGRLSEGRLGTTSTSVAGSILDDRMLEMCQAMKAEGMIIYTMTFGPSPDAGTKTLFESCATEPGMYFHAATSATLQQAFVEIADQLSALRIAE
jgi:Flp pilus assembly protein TadG